MSKSTKRKTKTNYYVDNEKLAGELTQYRKDYYAAKEQQKPKPQIPKYVVESILKIADGFASLSSFRNYTYLDQMKSDGIENCIRYVHNFDVTVSKNAYGYITKTMYWAFLHRLDVEKKQTRIKDAMLKKVPYDHEFEHHNDDVDIHTDEDSFSVNYANRDGLYAQPKIKYDGIFWNNIQGFDDLEKFTGARNSYLKRDKNKNKPQTESDNDEPVEIEDEQE